VNFAGTPNIPRPHDPRQAADADNYSPDRDIKSANQKERQPAMRDSETNDNQGSLDTQLDALEKAVAESAAAATPASSRTGLTRVHKMVVEKNDNWDCGRLKNDGNISKACLHDATHGRSQ
jgi:hypothetical protein